MNTPIADFLEDYEKKGMLRLHMPGHNGEAPHDITAVSYTHLTLPTILLV